jgi:hypothetical protein
VINGMPSLSSPFTVATLKFSCTDVPRAIACMYLKRFMSAFCFKTSAIGKKIGYQHLTGHAVTDSTDTGVAQRLSHRTRDDS